MPAISRSVWDEHLQYMSHCEVAKSTEFAVLSLCGAANLHLCVYPVPAISRSVRGERYQYMSLCETAKSSEFAVLSLCGVANLQLCVYAVPAISGPVQDERFLYVRPSVSLCETCILSLEGV